MIKEIQEINFPDYATLSSATVTLNDMGDRTISTQVKVLGDIAPDFSYDWEVEFKGERYIHPLHNPQASKGNESIFSTIDLTFYHKAIWQLKRYFFVEMASTESGTPIADKYIASLGLNLGDFCVAFNKVLDYYFDGAIRIELNPDWQYSNERVFIDISYSYLWDILQKIHELYDVRWYFERNNDAYTIKVGYPSTDVSHIFEYGFEGGLLRVERQVQDTNIRNSLLGRGGSKNLPTYYFKNAPEGTTFPSDPDAIPELENIYFSELRGKTFRDYVKGWKAKRYGGEPMQSPTKAYIKGYNDDKFLPVEYVEDEASIAKYGLLQGGLSNNEDIYPSIQHISREGIGLINEVIAVEQVLSDDVDSSIDQSSAMVEIDSTTKTILASAGSRATYKVRQNTTFEVPSGEDATLVWTSVLKTRYAEAQNALVIEDSAMRVYNATTNEEVSSVNISEGTYYYVYEVKLHNTASFDSAVTIGVESVKLLKGESSDSWKPTFDIWIKNIWDTQKASDESDVQYVNRVWESILGSRGEEASIGFVSGWLAVSDYEFRIAKGGVAYDNSKSYNGVASEWRITLIKSDAEYEATGKYIPSADTNGQANAGDLFIFTGIEMPQAYVEFAEERVDLWKEDVLLDVSESNPTWVVSIDKVRVNTLSEGESNTLISQLNIGSQIHLRDKRFIESPYIDLYLQSITYNWREDSILPDIEVVLSDKVIAVKNPVAQIQGDIDAIKSQISGVSNLQQLIRKVGDMLYLRKDGFSDTSKSDTEFQKTIHGFNFHQGLVGGAGWGIYRDQQGRAVAEFDKLLVRNEMQVNNLIINQISHIGGSFICSAASIECTGVVEHEDGYECFFDQHEGTIGNWFAVDDIAYSNVWDAEGNQTKYYKRVVIRTTDNSIVLSKTNKDGNGIPEAKDVIVQMGNTSNEGRQGLIIITSIPVPTIAQYAKVNAFALPSPDTQIQPNNNIFSGTVHIKSNSTGFEELDAWKTISQQSADAYAKAEEALSNAGSGGVSREDMVKYVDDVFGGVQEQIDGVVESHFKEVDPMLTNSPAVDWTTAEAKAAHVGDTYTNIKTGRSWKWQLYNSSYQWVEIEDTATQKALQDAANAQDTADSKRRVFTSQPKPPYEVGDLWAAGDSAPLKRCIKNRATGSFVETDWELADNSQSYADSLFDTIEYGKGNLIRNSGFTGGYLSRNFTSSTSVSESSELFSPSLEYWSYTNATVQTSSVSESKAEVVLSSGSLSQTLKNNVSVGDNYIISFRAKGTSLTVSVAGVAKTVTLTSTWERYVIKFAAVSNNANFRITSATCTLCELQLERGNVPSSWSYSLWDYTLDFAYYQALQYLAGAIKDGSTTIAGGLILSNVLALGNYLNGEMTQMTAGVSGTYKEADDIAFWSGGTLQQAIATVGTFRNNPQYKPTEEEWAQMAKFAVTHGGEVFLRGYINALGGYFRGTVDIANEKILLNSDGSGHFANGNVRWDSAGRVQKSAPDSVAWVNVDNYKSGVIDYMQGSYIVLSYDSNADDSLSTYTLATPAFDNFSIYLRNGNNDGGQLRAVIDGNFKATKNGVTETASALTIDYQRSVADIIVELVYQSDGYWHLRSDDFGIGTNGVMYVGEVKSQKYLNGYIEYLNEGGGISTLEIVDGRIKAVS